MQFMFLFKLKISNYIQRDLGFGPFSSKTLLYFCYVLFCKLMNFYPRINKDDNYY